MRMQLLHYNFGQNVIRFFGGALFFIWGHQLATFLDQSAMLEEHLSQKKPWLPQITPKFGQKRALGGPKIGQFFCDSFVKTPIKHVGKI